MKPLKPSLTPCNLAAGVLVIGLSCCASAPEPTKPVAEQAPEIEPPEITASQVTPPEAARAGITTLEFKVEIAAPLEEVWDTMLSPEGYQQWTKPFMAGSYFEGSWTEGERMHFLAPGGSGMVAVIAVNRPHELVSIEHIGFVAQGVEDTSSEAVLSWAPAYENYRFAAVPGGTEVTIEHEVLVGFEGYMNQVWPKALAALESLCEAN